LTENFIKKPLGCLLLHGFTSHVNCIDPVEPRVKKLGLPYRTPILRGHGTKPADLEGVKWQDWVEDGEKALLDLLNECEKVVIVALSMGSLVGMQLTLKYQPKIAGLVCIAPALKVKSPLAAFAPLIARYQKTHRFKFDPKGYYDIELAKTSQNYQEVPSASVIEFLKFGKLNYSPAVSTRITVPIQIISSTNDRTIDHRTAQWLYNTVSSKDKNIAWFYRSGHEMLRDAEREEVLDVIEEFVARLKTKAEAETSAPAPTGD
jgi:carboxylesterase